MAKITKEAFGELKNGRLITLYTLENSGGMRVRIMDYGARVQSLIVPDREGKSIDVALGYDDLKGYEADDKYFGAIVGRSVGRIAFGDLPIDDEKYVLECNEGRNLRLIALQQIHLVDAEDDAFDLRPLGKHEETVDEHGIGIRLARGENEDDLIDIGDQRAA